MSPVLDIKGAQGGTWKSTPAQEPPIPPKVLPAFTSWTRPADWLPTSVVAGEQKIQMLVAISQHAPTTPLVLRFTGGPYMIDWGDGTAPEGGTTTVSHIYTFATASNPTTEGFKQALVTITSDWGNTFTGIYLRDNFPGGGVMSSPVMEVIVGPNTITTFDVGSTTVAATKPRLRNVEFLSPVVLAAMLGRFALCQSLRRVAGQISCSSAGTATSIFQGCYNLESPPEMSFPTITSVNGMYQDCSRLVGAPAFTAPLSTNFGSLFNNCVSLTRAPYLDTSQATTLSGIFTNCYHLTSVPPYNTSNVQYFPNMFSSCQDLEYIPLMDTSKATDLTSMFSNCSSLLSLPAVDTSNAIQLGTYALGCYLLETVPTLNTAKAINFTTMFSGCYRLVSVPNITVISTATSLSSMYTNCQRLTSIPVTWTAPATASAGNMFTGCTSLLVAPSMNLSAATTVAGLFANCAVLVDIGTMNVAAATGGSFSVSCYNLRKVAFTTGPKFAFTLADTMLDQPTLDAIYTSLQAATQTITVTNVPGALTDTPSIATAKGWTVTGS